MLTVVDSITSIAGVWCPDAYDHWYYAKYYDLEVGEVDTESEWLWIDNNHDGIAEL